jgi:hypothetical protein
VNLLGAKGYHSGGWLQLAYLSIVKGSNFAISGFRKKKSRRDYSLVQLSHKPWDASLYLHVFVSKCSRVF